MDDVQAQFLQILSDYIKGQKTDIGIVDQQLCRYANQHQLGPILYAQTKYPPLLSAYYSAVSAYVSRDRLCKSLIQAMGDAGITAFQIKGSIIASCYPQPALRTSGDCDVVVSDLERAHQVMLAQGFTCLTKYIGREWQYTKNGMEFELHDRLVFDEAINDDKLTTYLNQFWPYVTDGVLDANFHFIYVIAHLRKHLMNAGVGFRQFLDVAMIWKNSEQLDWAWIRHELAELDLLPFAQRVFAFITLWWGIEPPFETVEISRQFYDFETNFIFENGVFGFDNPANDDYLTANETRKNGRFYCVTRALFPGYGTLCSSDTYHFLRNRPLLLPVAWVYRLFRFVASKSVKDMEERVAKQFVSREYIEQREEMFRSWGLVN